MRAALFALSLVLVPTMAGAQAQTGAAPASPLKPRAQTTAPLEAAEAAPEDNTPPLAAGKERILSKNEAYNQARAADGRVGVRLGNDMSYRITGN
jgi:hypothetical protein